MNTITKWFWEQHSNPWSVITRFLAFFFLIPAVWYHHLYVVGGLVLILIISTLLFPKPKSTDNWLTKSVLGEQMWLAKDTFNIVHIVIGIVAYIILLIAAFNHLVALTIIFFVGIFGWKILFIYRMVHYYEEHSDKESGYPITIEGVGEKYRCTVCGNEITVTQVGGGELVCCNKPMERLS